MRIANLAGRAVLLTADGAIDIHKATGGQLGPDPQSLFDAWQDAQPVLAALDPAAACTYNEENLRAPVPRSGRAHDVSARSVQIGRLAPPGST